MPNIQDYVLNYLIGAILYAAGTVFIFNSYKLLEASQIAIITSTNALITIFTALIFLNEPFTFQNLIGTILILSAIVLVNANKKGLTFNKGTMYAILFAICFGVALVNDKYILLNSGASATSYTVIIFLLPTILLILTRPMAIKKMNRFLKPNILIKMLLFSGFYATSAIIFFIALNSGATASQIAPINKSSVIVTVVLAAIFLGEKDRIFKKVIAAILVVIGVYLLR
jgi:transporter family protein